MMKGAAVEFLLLTKEAKNLKGWGTASANRIRDNLYLLNKRKEMGVEKRLSPVLEHSKKDSTIQRASNKAKEERRQQEIKRIQKETQRKQQAETERRLQEQRTSASQTTPPQPQVPSGGISGAGILGAGVGVGALGLGGYALSRRNKEKNAMMTKHAAMDFLMLTKEAKPVRLARYANNPGLKEWLGKKDLTRRNLHKMKKDPYAYGLTQKQVGKARSREASNLRNTRRNMRGRVERFSEREGLNFAGKNNPLGARRPLGSYRGTIGNYNNMEVLKDLGGVGYG